MQYLIPAIVLFVLIAFGGVIRLAARNYIKVAPNEVAIVCGSRHRTSVIVPGQAEPKSVVRGFRIVTGGAFFKIPIRDRVEMMKLNLMQISVQVVNVPDINGVRISVKGIANLKVLSDMASLVLAVERFLGFGLDYIEKVAKENLESNLRAVVGKMAVEELIRDRTKLQQMVTEEAVQDMAKMGLGLDLMNVQEISDEQGYIEALGKKRTAEIKRNATIGEAEALRDAAIKSAEAKQAGETAKAAAEQAISDANKDMDVRIAENNATVQAQKARIPIVANQAAAEEQRILNVKLVEADKAKTEAEILLQEAAQKRREAELDATTIIEAQKSKEAKIIEADAEAQAAERKGEAYRIQHSKEGEGNQAKLTAEAKGRKEAASATQAELVAQAEGKKAGLLADAEGKKAGLLADAEGVRQTGLARAAGVEAVGLAEGKASEAKAAAYKQLDGQGMMLMFIQQSPEVIEALGKAIGNAIAPSANAIGQGLANIQELRMVDLGGGMSGSAGKDNILGQFTKMPIETIYGLVERMKATGMAPAIIKLAKDKFGLDLESVFAGAPNPKQSPSGRDATHPEGDDGTAAAA
ncbi:MAG: SPFH domain-containing protein [Patescibacteria group bacterium]